MKYNDFIKTKGIQKYEFSNKTVRPSDITFKDFYEDISDRWQEKARDLQRRRWRKIKQHLA